MATQDQRQCAGSEDCRRELPSSHRAPSLLNGSLLEQMEDVQDDCHAPVRPNSGAGKLPDAIQRGPQWSDDHIFPSENLILGQLGFIKLLKYAFHFAIKYKSNKIENLKIQEARLI